jgi:hypothetical protein
MACQPVASAQDSFAVDTGWRKVGGAATAYPDFTLPTLSGGEVALHHYAIPPFYGSP